MRLLSRVKSGKLWSYSFLPHRRRKKRPSNKLIVRGPCGPPWNFTLCGISVTSSYFLLALAVGTAARSRAIAAIAPAAQPEPFAP